MLSAKSRPSTLQCDVLAVEVQYIYDIEIIKATYGDLVSGLFFDMIYNLCKITKMHYGAELVVDRVFLIIWWHFLSREWLNQNLDQGIGK